jgi:NAD-dependent SIR2 family protein deacetylase
MNARSRRRDTRTHVSNPRTVSKLDEVEIDRLASWIRDARVVVWFTGAGISTESGLPDFRGPNGVWTRAEKGLSRPALKRPMEQIEPNAAHLAITGFEKIGKCDFLVSQNVDNLHLKSGYPCEKLAELHGNQFRLRCWPCDKTFPLADFRTPTGERRRDKGRFVADRCPDCGGRLTGSVINFGDPIPREALATSLQWARQADVMIVVGSTCQVFPAAQVPRATKQSGGRLAIVNLGETDLDPLCDLRFHAKAGILLPSLLAKVRSH